MLCDDDCAHQKCWGRQYGVMEESGETSGLATVVVGDGPGCVGEPSQMSGEGRVYGTRQLSFVVCLPKIKESCRMLFLLDLSQEAEKR